MIAAADGSWRKEPPTLDEVREHHWWWVKEPDRDPTIVCLAFRESVVFGTHMVEWGPNGGRRVVHLSSSYPDALWVPATPPQDIATPAMSPVEQTVWAAAYVRYFTEQADQDTRGTFYEENYAVFAINYADRVVKTLREAQKERRT